MKKKFIRVMLLGALTLTTSASFISCKDYDDDISRLETKDTELGTQLTALQTALDAAKTEAAAAKTAAEAAKTAADAAKAAGDAAAAAAADAKVLAEEAKAAAATAKAEAIAAAKAEVAELAKTVATKEELNALGSKIEGIQGDLNKLADKVDVSEFIKYQEAIRIQLAALESFKTATGTDIANIKTELETLKSSMPTDGNIKAIAEAAANAVQLALGSEINTLAGVLANRLTSVTLVPKLYIDGIPTIDFRTAVYQPVKLVAGKLVPTDDAKVSISNGTTKASYRMNPTNVGVEDLGTIEQFAFVSNEAETRAADPNENSLIKPVKFEIDPISNIMTIWATKTVTESFNRTGNKIYTVSLKAPIAAKNLLKGESASYVYSEYTRLAESTFLPQIAANPYTDATVVNHYSDSLTLYTSANTQKIDVKVNYQTGVDLNTLVTGCYMADSKHNQVTTEELKSYGLAFRFAIPKTLYINSTVSNTDQQQFASVNAKGHLSSKLPDGVTDNEASVDKEPIVRIMLVDTVRHKLVDQRYMKVQFKKEAQKPVELGEIATYERPLGCNTLKMDFTWDQMTNLVYAKMKDGAGMSKEDFHKIYTDAKWTGDGSKMTISTDTVGAGTKPMTWEMDVDAVGTIAPALTKDYTAQIIFKDPKGLYGDVTFSFKLTVKAVLPTLNGFYNQYWLNGSPASDIYPVYPVQYQSSMAPNTTCVYFNNMFNAFTFNTTPCLLNGMTTCGTWDLQFAKAGQLSGFAPSYVGNEPDREKTFTNGGYSLLMNTSVPAAKLAWESPRHLAWGDNAATVANVSLNKARGGKDLLTKLKYVNAKDVANFKNVKMGIWSTINEHNCYEIKKYNAVFVAPLAINAAIEDAAFYDGVIDGSKVAIAGAFKFTDFRGYTVAKVATGTTDKEKYAGVLYKYYEVQDPTWDTANAKIGMKNSGGSLVVDDALTAANSIALQAAYAGASITVDSNGNLVFKNNSGSNVEQACNIFIKATVVYGWGTEEEWVKVRLNPAK